MPYLFILFLIIFSPTVHAESSSTAVKAVPTPSVESAEGKIEKVEVDGAQSWVTIQTKNKLRLKLKIDPQTSSIWSNGRKIGIDRLKNNLPARIRYTDRDGVDTVKSIEILESE